MKNKNKQKRSAIKNTFYALKTISKCAPLLISSYVLTQTAHWFFTGFIQQILFLKLLLQLIENGRVVECGSHDELMEQNGKYAYMFRLQAEKYTDE